LRRALFALFHVDFAFSEIGDDLSPRQSIKDACPAPLTVCPSAANTMRVNRIDRQFSYRNQIACNPGRFVKKGGFMTSRWTAAVAAGIFAVSIGILAWPVKAGGDKVSFPQNFASGVMFATVDRADIKQYRELFAPAAAIEAAKMGKPLPSGTVITLVQYAAQLGSDGSPVKDANGRFIKTNIVGFAVMEKRTGWGAEYPESLRNGEWEYQSFTPDKKVNEKANLSGCMNCHRPLNKQDFVFSYVKMKNYAE
jgi:hypothetical protein